MGTVIILFTGLLTEGNPASIGIVYFAVFYIGRHYSEGFYNPLVVFIKYLLGRMSLQDSMYHLVTQYLAAFAVFVTFVPIKTLMNDV
jgi:hypothetical protein